MAAVLNHESFTQPADPAIPLWRYMDLSKFAALLQKRALTFPRCDRLGDPFEGSVSEPTARFWDAIRAMNASGAETPFSTMSDEVLERFATGTRKTRQRMTMTTYVSCWHMNEAESAAMWRLYSKSADAVCIRTDYATLAEVLPNECFLGVVRYINYKTDLINAHNLLNTIMTKRRSFAHEREARAVIWDGEAPDDQEMPVTKDIPINLNALLKGVFVSPEAPDWFKDVVEGLTATYGMTLTVEHSEINATPLY